MSDNCKYMEACKHKNGSECIIDGNTECQIITDCKKTLEGQNCNRVNSKDVCIREKTADKCDVAIKLMIPIISGSLKAKMPWVEWNVRLYGPTKAQKAWCKSIEVNGIYYLAFRCDDYPYVEDNSKCINMYGHHNGRGDGVPHDISSVGIIQFLEYKKGLNTVNEFWPKSPPQSPIKIIKMNKFFKAVSASDLFDSSIYGKSYIHVDDIVKDVNGKNCIILEESGIDNAYNLAELFVEWILALRFSALFGPKKP